MAAIVDREADRTHGPPGVKSLDWHGDGGAVALGLVYLVSRHGVGWMARETQTRTVIGLDHETEEAARLACQEDFEIRVLAYVR